MLWALGKDYEGMEQYSLADSFYGKSLDVYRQIGNRYSQAILWRAIGDIRVKLNQMQEAQQAYAAACEFYRAIGLEESAKECEEINQKLSHVPSE